MTTRTKAVFMLFIDAIISAIGYIFLKVALDAQLSPGLVVMLRGMVATIVCVCFYYKHLKKITKKDFLIGSALGIINFIAFILTTLSMDLSTPSNTSFLLACGIVLVPLLEWLLHKRKPTTKTIVCALGCMVGMVILTGILNSSFSLNLGNLFAFAAALIFSLHIIYVGKWANSIDHRILIFFMMIYMFIGGFIYALCTPGAFSLANVDVFKAIYSIVGLGAGASFMYFLIQVTAQMHVSATTASLILSADSLLTSLLSIALGYEHLTLELVVGGIIIMASVFALEYTPKRKRTEEVPLDEPIMVEQIIEETLE